MTTTTAPFTATESVTTHQAEGDTAVADQTVSGTNPAVTLHMPTPAQHLEETTTAIGIPRETDVDIILPAYNEEEQLSDHALRLAGWLRNNPRFSSQGSLPQRGRLTWQIVIADNASTDATWRIAHNLSAAEPEEFRAIRLTRKGRGHALKTAWDGSHANILAYMDVDLSTNLDNFTALVESLLTGKADMAIGSRLLPASRVRRSLKREVISRGYNSLLRHRLGAMFADAQCGFKAVTAHAWGAIGRHISDDEWFFDTELLIKAQYAGLAIAEIPVAWVEDAGTTVDIPATVRQDLRGISRVRKELEYGQETEPIRGARPFARPRTAAAQLA